MASRIKLPIDLRCVPPACLFFVLAQSVSHAASEMVPDQAIQERIAISRTETTQALKKLSRLHGFDVAGLSKIGGRELTTVPLAGRLDDILERLLRNFNYLIVRTAAGGGEIRRIIILNSSGGAGRSRGVSRRLRPLP